MKKYMTFYLMAVLLLFGACNGFLEVKPDKALLVPTTLDDFDLLLNDDTKMNVSNGIGILSDDDHYFTDATYAALRTPLERTAYTWEKDLFEGGSTTNWNTAYEQIFNANIVLEGLEKIVPKTAEVELYKRLKGSAYFYRAWALYHTVSCFAPQYTAVTAVGLPGIPVYTKANVNLRPGRGTLENCYAQINQDLEKAKQYLPISTAYLTRPNKAAAFALGARVYLAMADYTKAGIQADSVLKYQNTLMDYKTISTTATRPFTRTNVEVIYQCRVINQSTFSATGTLIDSLLYQSYSVNDLRRSIFFKTATGGVNFKGSYDGTANLFSGLTVDEVYLIRAECRARATDANGAMQDLNTLLAKRYKTGFVGLTASNAAVALQLVLNERRKELVFRGLRFTDLKRLNLEPNFAITLKRNLNGKIYTLPPNDKRYVIPIPDQEILLGGLTGNER